MDRSIDTSQNPTGDDLQMVKMGEESPKPTNPEDTSPVLPADPPSPPPKRPFFQKLIPFKRTPALTEHASRPKWYRRPWLIITLVVLLLLLTIFGWLGLILYQTSEHIQGVASHGRSVVAAFEARDLALAKLELEQAGNSLADANTTYQRAKPLAYLPFLGNYLKDGQSVLNAGNLGLETGGLVLAALEPYADVLGFAGAETKLDFESAEDRIVFLSETVEKLTPQMADISIKLQAVSQELAQIDETRYPKRVGDLEVRAEITNLKSTISSTANSLEDFQPFIKLLPDLLGNPDEKKYLILFQNDAELRPTGGFMTAYATMGILKGKITPGVSEDIYTLDNAFSKKVPAPDPIRKYLPLVYNWNLRDMNLSPDFKVSMDTFTEYYQQVPIAPEVDAIIAIDTHVPVKILEILGPIGVGGYAGEFSAEIDPRCDCPQVIYELENIITRPTYEIREGRKSILGPLMNSMLANMMGSPKSKWPEFFSVFSESIHEKHLMMYFFDEEKQAAVEALGAAGRISAYEGDYLHINDTNFAGAKSNLFVEQEIEQVVNIGDDGSLTKKITLTYRNPAPPSNCNLEAGQLCLNGVLRDWIRVYVPEGSTLQAARGFEVDLTTTEDLGKTVFEGFFTLAPESVKKLELEYTVPAGTIEDDTYKLLIQKQPGTKEIKHSLTLGGATPKLDTLLGDTEISLPR